MQPQPTPPPARTGQRENARLVEAFDSYLARQARSTGTRRKYGDAVAHYTTWLRGRAPGTLAAEEIDRYLERWRHRFQHNNGRPPATASYRAQINALRAFYAYLDRFSLITDPHGRPQPDPMRKILPPCSQPASNDWLRPAEDTALLSCDGTLQERFLIALLRRTGLRVSEASALTLADLDLSPGNEALTVRHSKTPAGRRTIPIIPELHPLLQHWLHHLDSHQLTGPAVPLLSSRHATPMPISFAWRLVKRVAHRAGVRPRPCTCQTPRPPHHPGCPQNQNGHNKSDVSPHTLRRTFASDLLNRGLRLEVVSKLLGHATTTTTEHAYAQLLDDTTRRELLHALHHHPPKHHPQPHHLHQPARTSAPARSPAAPPTATVSSSSRRGSATQSRRARFNRNAIAIPLRDAAASTSRMHREYSRTDGEDLHFALCPATPEDEDTPR
jgi:site-specific recombinase XerD